MPFFCPKWLRQPVLTQFENAQRSRILNTMLWIILAAGAALFLVNIYIRAWNIALAVLMISFFCAPAFALNARGHYNISASLILCVILCVANYNLYATGGLQDSGMLAYPLIIIVGSLFFGARAIPVLTLASIGSLAIFGALESRGIFIPAHVRTDAGYCLSVGVLLFASSALVWVIIRTTESNIARIRNAEAELLSTYNLTLEALAKTLELRDRETEGHSRRVVELSMRLAREMGCNEEEISHIKRGALLHDIGKMAIPDNILSKPGPLDREEKKTMERHTVYAKQLLEPITFLRPASAISYCHHERWDGGGYPQGLKGEEIPFPARLFAIVDQWDALSSDRPYHTAWPRDKIISYLRDNSGKSFDPRVVEAFLRIVGKSG